MGLLHKTWLSLALFSMAACGGDPFATAELAESRDGSSRDAAASAEAAADANRDGTATDSVTTPPADAAEEETGAGTPPDAPGETTAPLDAGVDSVAPDVEAGPLFPRYIPCSGDNCRVGEQKCCVVNAAVPDFCVGGPDDPTDCTSEAGSTALFECDDGEDCANLGKPGMVCCGKDRSINTDFGYAMWTKVVCVPADECSPTADDVFCGHTVSGCPQDRACTQDQYPYTVCE